MPLVSMAVLLGLKCVLIQTSHVGRECASLGGRRFDVCDVGTTLVDVMQTLVCTSSGVEWVGGVEVVVAVLMLML